MNIKRAEIYKVSLPLKEPFRVSFTSMDTRELVIIKLFDKSGRIGFGETANFNYPFYAADFNDGTVHLLKEYILPKILNKNINTIEEVEDVYRTMAGNNFTKVTLEAAFWHLKSQETGKALKRFWGGVKEKIPVAISIGLGVDLKDTISRVSRYIQKFEPKRAKIK